MLEKIAKYKPLILDYFPILRYNKYMTMFGVDRLNYKLSCAAFLTAALFCATVTSCGKQKNSAPVSESETTTYETVAEKITETSTNANETTTAATTTETSQEETTAAVETVQETTETVQHGFSTPYEAAQFFYNAYLSSNSELIYSMFCQSEIDAYNAYIDSQAYFDAPAAEIFSKAAVEAAISASMQNIANLRADNQDSETDGWTVSLTEEDIIQSTPEDVAAFNETLGTSFTSGADCAYVYYQDLANQRAFVGNGCAFVESDGRWYLSYSSAIQSELLNYMNLF